VPDRQFSDIELAELYDLFHPPDGRADFRFYLPMVMSAEAVLDVGCGTGALLHAAREAGHRGQLVGLDPAFGMIETARERRDIEWILGSLATISFVGEFDLVVMTGHAFQVLIEDAELEAALRAIRSALKGNGRLAFETRNPFVREWEEWTPERISGVTTDAGIVVFMRDELQEVRGQIVRFTTTFESRAWDEPKKSESTLRFVDSGRLALFLSDAGFVIEDQFGDWDRQPLTDATPEMITIARRQD
jgi:SAM-dependent methyltransferase